MPYEITDTWSPDGRIPLPRGWYRLASGRLTYWDGTAWSGSARNVTTEPGRLPEPEPNPSAPLRVWTTALTTAGWIAAIMVLGLVLASVHVAGADCGTVFSPLADAAERCAAALDARARTAAIMAGVAVLCFLGAVGIRRVHCHPPAMRRGRWTAMA